MYKKNQQMETKQNERKKNISKNVTLIVVGSRNTMHVCLKWDGKYQIQKVKIYLYIYLRQDDQPPRKVNEEKEKNRNIHTLRQN